MRVPLVSVLVSCRASFYPGLDLLSKPYAYILPSDRPSGWAPKGSNPTVVSMLKRSKRWSILPAFTLKGYIAHVIHQGSITMEIFNDFVRNDVLPFCQPFPAPQSVLICDNHKTHRSQELEDMCAEAGVILAYLPPYSPDFNPIETSFALLKAWIKRNAELFNEEDGASGFRAFLEMAIAQQDYGAIGNPAKLFQHAGVELGHQWLDPLLASDDEENESLSDEITT